VQNARETEQEMGRMNIKRLPDQPCSIVPSPCNFWFFGRAKRALLDRRFADADPVVELLTNLSESVTIDELRTVVQDWIEKFEWIIEHHEEGFIK
jgi:hypothetical protein